MSHERSNETIKSFLFHLIMSMPCVVLMIILRLNPSFTKEDLYDIPNCDCIKIAEIKMINSMHWTVCCK